MKTLIFSLLLAVSLVSGCAKPGLVGSFAGPLPEKDAVSAIAGDAVSILAGLYPPGHTTLHVLPAKDAANGFALALDKELRATGFTMAADAADVVTVAYTLDMLEDKAAWYLRLRLSDGGTIARAYDAHGQPEAGQSRTVLEAVQSGLGKAVDTVKEKAGNAYEATRDFLNQ
jgi:hypothetical protein